jgi:hypothetical protein
MTIYSEGETTQALTTEAVSEPPELPVGSLKLVELTETVSAGKKASVTVNGLPDTEYSITVTYATSVSQAQGLEPKYSDANGIISWSWRVGNQTKPGEYKIEIQCKTEKITLYFTVTEPQSTKE